MDKARKVELLKSLVETLCMERDADVPRTEDAEELWAYFRALVNTRPPWPTDAGFLAAQDELLQGRGNCDSMTPADHDAGLLAGRSQSAQPCE